MYPQLLSFNQCNEELITAAQKGENDKIKKLLDNNHAYVNYQSQSTQRLTALSWAAHNGQLETVRLLLNTYHADSSIIDIYGNTCLHWAAYHGHCDIVQLLIDINPSLATKANKNGLTYSDLARNKQQTLAPNLFLPKCYI